MLSQHQSYIKCRICTVDQVDWSIETQKRSGVILATIHPQNGQFLYGMAIDRNHNEYTDFGGGREPKDGNPLNCGLREFREETLGIFCLTFDDVKNSHVLITEKMVFVIYSIDWSTMTKFKKRFTKLVNTKTKSENSGFRLLTQFDMRLLLTGKPVDNIVMYNKVIKELNKGFELLNIMVK